VAVTASTATTLAHIAPFSFSRCILLPHSTLSRRLDAIGWNCTVSVTTRLYRNFRAPEPAKLYCLLCAHVMLSNI
jgi:hypothetical protein